MEKEELIYDGYVKIYEVTKNNNGKIEKFTKVQLRGASAGIVINEEGKMALVTQYRPIIGVKTLEVPAGTLDKDISPKEIIIAIHLNWRAIYKYHPNIYLRLS